MNPYLFIVGCPRSGTTLVRRMVDAHPLIAITRETHWIADGYERRGDVTPELLRSLREEPRFARIETDPGALDRLVEQGVSYPRLVSALFDAYARSQGKPLAGDKTPKYVRHVRALAELWPQIRIVHLIRDGRDVCLSALNWTRLLPSLERRFPTWAEEPVITAALWWEWHVRPARADGLALGPERYHELGYERLVADPERTCAALCEFLGVPYDDAMVRFHEGRTREQPGRDAKSAWLPVTSGLRDWRSELPADDVAAFEAAAGELLDELGYERAVASPPADALARAEATRAAFAQRAEAVPANVNGGP